MATDEDVRTARRRGEEEGFATAIAKVRAFTGVQGIEPALDLPEHISYPAYLRALHKRYSQLLQAIQTSDRDIAWLEERFESAIEEHAQLLEERHAERTGRNAIVRAIGTIADKNLPTTRAVRNLEQRLDAEQELLAKQQQIAAELHHEARRVDQWIIAMIESVEEVQAQRRAEEEHRRQVAEWEARDVSPRWCKVYTLEAFIDEDERRQARGWDREADLVVAGADFGYRWHRDADAGPDAEGSWSLHYIRETHETILEYRPLAPSWTEQPSEPIMIWLLGNAIESMEEAEEVFPPIERRQGERNSLALVLDAYSEYARQKKTATA